jgi:predicted site-specific integrase-resolvase
MSAQANEWMNPKQLCEEFGIAEATQAVYRSDKKIPYSKVGGFIFYKREKIYQWLEKHSIAEESIHG